MRGATRSLEKGKSMINARPRYHDRLEFVQVDDFSQKNVFTEAVKGVDAVIHVASVRSSQRAFCFRRGIIMD